MAFARRTKKITENLNHGDFMKDVPLGCLFGKTSGVETDEAAVSGDDGNGVSTRDNAAWAALSP